MFLPWHLRFNEVADSLIGIFDEALLQQTNCAVELSGFLDNFIDDVGRLACYLCAYFPASSWAGTCSRLVKRMGRSDMQVISLQTRGIFRFSPQNRFHNSLHQHTHLSLLMNEATIPSPARDAWLRWIPWSKDGLGFSSLCASTRRVCNPSSRRSFSRGVSDEFGIDFHES
jgi:hypothetical protein